MCPLQVNPLFGTIYNSIYLLAKSIHNVRKGGMQLSGSNLAYFLKNTTFSGFNQKVQVDTSGNVKTNYVVLDSDNRGSQLYQTYLVDLKSGSLRFAGRSINFPGGSPPPSDSSCWFENNATCTGGKELHFEAFVCEYWFTWMDVLAQVLTVLCHVLHTLQLPVVILRCRGHLHHSGVSCHLHSGCGRARYKSLYQVQPD